MGPTTRPTKAAPVLGPGSEAKKGLEGSEPPMNAPQGHPSERTPAQERAPRAERPGHSLPHGGEGEGRNAGPLYLLAVRYFVHCGYLTLMVMFTDTAGKHHFSGLRCILEPGFPHPVPSHGSRALLPGAPHPLSGPLDPSHCDLPRPPAGEGFLRSGSWCPPEYVTAVRSFPSDGTFWRLGKSSLASSNDPGGGSKQQAGPLRAADPPTSPPESPIRRSGPGQTVLPKPQIPERLLRSLPGNAPTCAPVAGAFPSGKASPRHSPPPRRQPTPEPSAAQNPGTREDVQQPLLGTGQGTPGSTCTLFCYPSFSFNASLCCRESTLLIFFLKFYVSKFYFPWFSSQTISSQ